MIHMVGDHGRMSICGLLLQAGRHLGVYLGCGKLAVAQQFLDYPYIGSALEKDRGE